MPLLKKGDKVGLVGCSNPQALTYKIRIDELIQELESLGLRVEMSPCIYEREDGFNGTAKEKAEAFMAFYKDPEIQAIFDLSGGDLANEVLEYFNYELMRNLPPKAVFGYSDLTTVLNALYTKANIKPYLYQIRFLIGSERRLQKERLRKSLFEGQDDLFSLDYKFVQGEKLEGVVVGGNIRCFLKLAGTSYMPDFKDKVLLLESYSGGPMQMSTYLNQYKQLGVFKQIKGILLGSYTVMEQEHLLPTIEELVQKIVDDPTMPIVKTSQIGHNMDSKCIKIGQPICLEV